MPKALPMKTRGILPLSGVLLSLHALSPLFAQNPVPAPPTPTPAPTAPVKPAGYKGDETPDETGAIWKPAAATNFTAATRPTSHPVDTVVIHDIEGPAVGAVSWFQNPQSKVSAHYVVDAVEGTVWQQVLEHDIAWHAGNWNINTRSIGIEHEGFAYRPGYYTPRLYEASAALVRDITRRHNIPRDRQHIIGHFEVPHPRDATKFGGAGGHTDPGPYWDWGTYMTLVRNDARLEGSAPAPITIHPGEKVPVTITLANIGDDPWPANPKAKHDVELENSGPIYLGTANGEPGLCVGKEWVSPRLAAPLADETAPTAIGTFPVTLTGPRTLGALTENLRAVKVSPAPHIPVPFGATVTLSVNVTPWEIVWDTRAPVFSASGWNPTTAKDRPLFWAKSPASAALWSGPLPITGLWDIYVRWTAGDSRTTEATYEVQTGEGPKTITLDQRKRAGEWVLLGRFPLSDPQAVKISLQTGKKGITVAEGVRFVGPFPAVKP